MIRAVFILILLLASPAEAKFSCKALYAVAKQGLVNYGREVRETYGLRLLFRHAAEHDDRAARRLFLFWAEVPPGETPLRVQAWAATRKVFGAKPLPPDDRLRRRFEIASTIDHVAQWPVRRASRSLVGRGWLEQEKTLTLPALIILTTPAWTHLMDGYNGGVAWIVDRLERKEDESLLRDDFRFSALAKAARRQEDTYRRMETAGLLTDAGRDEHREFQERLHRQVAMLISQHRDYEKAVAKFEKLYRRAPNEAARQKLIQDRYAEIASGPLFQDLPQRAAQSPGFASLSADEQEERRRALVGLRERLFYRYHLIDTAIGATEKRLANENFEPAMKEEIRAIRRSPVFRELVPLYTSGKIPYGSLRRALMEDAFWEIDRFGGWRALGQEPPLNPNASAKAPASAVRQEDIQAEIIESLRPQKKAPGGPGAR